MLVIRLTLGYSLFLFPFFLLSQSLNLGTPDVRNYSKEEYSGGTQCWDALYGKNDLIYFANNDGLVFFDGNRWAVKSLPGATILRSIDMRKSGEIYAGGQDEVGYFKPDEKGDLVFYSIKEKIPDRHRNLEDIWEMVAVEDLVFFRSNDKIFRYDQEQFGVYENSGAITFLARLQEAVIFNDISKGLFKWQNADPLFIPGSEIFRGIPITDIIDVADNYYLILTERNGVYACRNNVFTKWETNVGNYLEVNRIGSGALLQKEEIAIGTLLGGLLVFDKDGKAIYKITKENGLQNNSISTICTDKSNNLWLGTYNGIDQVILSDQLNLFYPDGQLEGAVYDIESWNGHLFFGTNNGLYFIEQKDYYHPLQPQNMTLVPGSVGQVWGLDIVGDQLFMAHNDGAFQIKENFTAQKISPVPGAWKFIALSENKMVVGTYVGLDIYTKKNELWAWEQKLESFSESSRIMVLDNNKNLWVSHPYRGVYKIEFNNDFTKLNAFKLGPNEGINTNQRNYVFNIDGTATITNPEGVFTYNSFLKKFEPQELMAAKTEPQPYIKRLIQSGTKTWFISDSGVGEIYLKAAAGKQIVSFEKYPNINDVFVGGFENLFPLDSNHIFLCTDKGVLYYNKSNGSSNTNIRARISSLQLLQPKDSLLIDNNAIAFPELQLTSDENALKFHFTSDYFQNPEKVKYSFLLEGTDANWSEWSGTSSKEYTNLNHGSHLFQLKAMDPYGNISNLTTLHFQITPPWYKSLWANLFYLLLCGIALLGLILIPRKKFDQEKAILKSKQQQTAAEVEQLKNEKLETEIQFKNKELASTTMHLLQKNETLSLLKTQIDKIYKNMKHAESKKEVKKLISLIDNDTQLEADWKNFSYHFDQVHHNFLKRIKDNYPELTAKDLKLCAYLRMNLSTKEIAPLLNISVRGVEIGRYRLRKKLGIDKSVNLNNFMISY